MKDETAINSYELTLTPNYVSDWNFNDALRELIQNGTDQEVLDPDNEFQIDYSQKEKVLRLKNRKSVLKINTLLLGRSSKANNEDTVGQFGEGYKIAALVLNRLGKTFTIYNNEKNEVWESRFKNSEKWLEKILCFYVSKRKTDAHGLCIEGGERIMAEVKIWPRGQNETGGILLMPMKKNIPKGHPEWSLVKCPICGQECWRPMSRQEIRQKKMQAACTECGLKIESRRNQP